MLKKVGIPFQAVAPIIDEGAFSTLPAEEQVLRLAKAKGESILKRLDSSARWITGVDTLVKISGHILGKPGSREEAREYLKQLSGKEHSVFTAIALLPTIQAEWAVEYSKTLVRFRELTEVEIEWYLTTEEWVGAAGAYRIQERGAFHVHSINGSYSNVVGLPLSLFYLMLRRTGYPFFRNVV